MRDLRAAVVGIVFTIAPLTPAWANSFFTNSFLAHSFAPPPAAVAARPRPPVGSAPLLTPPTAVRGRSPQMPSRARLDSLERREGLLRRRMWRLQMRRQRFLTEGRPHHAHQVHERLIDLGWRLRQVQAAKRALGRR